MRLRLPLFMFAILSIFVGAKVALSLPVSTSTTTAKVGNKSLVLSSDNISYLINFKSINGL